MNSPFSRLYLVATTFLMLGAATPALAGPIVTGSGHISETELPLVTYTDRTLTISAIDHADGSITGNIQSVVHDDGALAHIDVDCVTYVDEDTVILTGEVTQLSQFPDRVGMSGGIVVRDGGPGSADQASPGFVFTVYRPEICNLLSDALNAYIVTLLGDTEDGNITVH